jgi:hypothetical protein
MRRRRTVRSVDLVLVVLCPQTKMISVQSPLFMLTPIDLVRADTLFMLMDAADIPIVDQPSPLWTADIPIVDTFRTHME